jgi:hypothetical protein
VARAAQHATVFGAQRHHVPRFGEIVGDAGRIGEQTHGRRAIGGRNARSHTIFGVDGDGVRSAVLVLVDRIHR